MKNISNSDGQAADIENQVELLNKNTKYKKLFIAVAILFGILAVVCIALLSITVALQDDYDSLHNSWFFYMDLEDELRSEIDDLNESVADWENSYNELKSSSDNKYLLLEAKCNSLEAKNKTLETENVNLSEKADWLDEYIAIVPDDGSNTYHTYDCNEWYSYSFWAYNIDAAKSKGIKKCTKCYR